MATLFKIPTVAGVTKATAKQQMLKQLICTDAPEQALRYHGFLSIAGVDEVGRGALFGPVVAAAVILPTKIGILSRMGLKDSKQLTREQRERLDRKIRKIALCFAIAEVDAETIDRINIYQASRLAMLLAVQQLNPCPDHLLIDALYIDLSQVAHPCAQTRLYYGDALSLSIAAASVIAKVHRDALMRQLDLLHPLYGLASHKGYATPEHRRALREHGPCALHRKTFAPVAASDPDALLEARIDSGDLFLDDLLDDPLESLLDSTSTNVVIPTEAPSPNVVISTEAQARNTVISTEPQSRNVVISTGAQARNTVISTEAQRSGETPVFALPNTHPNSVILSEAQRSRKTPKHPAPALPSTLSGPNSPHVQLLSTRHNPDLSTKPRRNQQPTTESSPCP